MTVRRVAAGASVLLVLVLVGACSNETSTDARGGTPSQPKPSQSQSSASQSSQPQSSSSGPSSSEPETSRPAGTTPNTVDTSTPAALRPLDPVPISEEASLSPGVSIRIIAVDRMNLTGQGPGDSSGPGIAVHVQMKNESTHDVDFSTLSTAAETADGTPLSPSRSEPASIPTGKLAPGKDGTAIWTFHVDGALDGTLIQVTHPASASIVQFRV